MELIIPFISITIDNTLTHIYLFGSQSHSLRWGLFLQPTDKGTEAQWGEVTCPGIIYEKASGEGEESARQWTDMWWQKLPRLWCLIQEPHSCAEAVWNQGCTYGLWSHRHTGMKSWPCLILPGIPSAGHLLWVYISSFGRFRFFP